jgi:hypothetical protein
LVVEFGGIEAVVEDMNGNGEDEEESQAVACSFVDDDDGMVALWELFGGYVAVGLNIVGQVGAQMPNWPLPFFSNTTIRV